MDRRTLLGQTQRSPHHAATAIFFSSCRVVCISYISIANEGVWRTVRSRRTRALLDRKLRARPVAFREPGEGHGVRTPMLLRGVRVCAETSALSVEPRLEPQRAFSMCGVSRRRPTPPTLRARTRGALARSASSRSARPTAAGCTRRRPCVSSPIRIISDSTGLFAMAASRCSGGGRTSGDLVLSIHSLLGAAYGETISPPRLRRYGCDFTLLHAARNAHWP